MAERHAQPGDRRLLLMIVAGFVVLIGTARCGNRNSGPAPSTTSSTIRIGVGSLPQLTAQAGLQQVVGNLSLEGLVRFYEDGRPSPWLAENWTTGPDNLSLTLQLRPRAKFHDGTAVTA